jgi:hypothetical protein
VIINEGAYFPLFFKLTSHVSRDQTQRQQCTQQTRRHKSSVPNRSWTSGLARYSTLGYQMEGSVRLGFITTDDGLSYCRLMASFVLLHDSSIQGNGENVGQSSPHVFFLL